jgi:uncharacterized membrane protein (DUF485 family)
VDAVSKGKERETGMDKETITVRATERSERMKQNFGLALCLIYAVVYATFVFISLYDVTLMDTVMPFGLNLAVFYGFGIILFALVLALIYSQACSFSERKARAEDLASTNQAAVAAREDSA